jgi:hypothetical protein
MLELKSKIYISNDTIFSHRPMYEGDELHSLTGVVCVVFGNTHGTCMCSFNTLFKPLVF